MAYSIIDKNYNAEEGSFLYYVHERDIFDTEELMKLCDGINELLIWDKDVVEKLFFIQTQTLRHIIYHFDSADQSEMGNLPDDYWKYIDMLEDSISKYIKGAV